MSETLPLFLRAHTEPMKARKRRSKERTATVEASTRPKPAFTEPKWPEHVLVFDTETTTDELQSLTFGTYRFCRLGPNGAYQCVEEGLFYSDDFANTNAPAIAHLQAYVSKAKAETQPDFLPRVRLLSRAEFVEEVFWRSINAGAAVVGYNLPFDLTRIAVACSPARRRDEGWSVVVSQDTDPKTGCQRNNPFRSRIVITPKDSKAAFIRLAGSSIQRKGTGKRFKRYRKGRFLDLRTLVWALTNKSYGLDACCRAFGIPGKSDHEPTGHVSEAEIDYCRNDVRVTVALLNVLKKEFDHHPVDLYPEDAYSPASIVKAYQKAMGIELPLRKFNIPNWVLAAAMQAYYGGRAEARIRHEAMPVVYTDFLSEYPTVNTLMGLWAFLTAKSLKFEDVTDDVRRLVTDVTPDVVFKKDFWEQLCFFALVEPEGDILPVRTMYNGKNSNIGINPLTSSEPQWFAGPDVVAAPLMTRRRPRIVRAFRVVPEGKQDGLRKVALRGMVNVDPASDDFFKLVIEARSQVKRDQSLPKPERDALSYFLKILANSGSYGLFVEVNPQNLGQGERAGVRVFSGEKAFKTTSPVVESPGAWYCPLFGALITAAGRLLLALLERSVCDEGGSYLLCDTDSMAIIASEHERLFPCAGGPHRSEDGRQSVKALSHDVVRGIVRKFEQLNPYDREAVPGSILKIEDVNFDGMTQREVWGYAIAAKRYALFTRSHEGGIQILKASAHGLGFLYAPTREFDAAVDAPGWVVEAWEWIMKGVFGLSRVDPLWFQVPAMMRIKITTPQILKAMQVRQASLAYRDRLKPFNFALSPIIDSLGGYPVGVDAKQFTLIAPFASNPDRWYRMRYTNVHNGKLYNLAPTGRRRSYEAGAKTIGEFVSQYQWHPEAKSLAPEGDQCHTRTRGLLKRTPVAADGFRYIGKETDRRWEQGEEISMLESEVVEYRPNETARLVSDPDLLRDARTLSIRELAKKAGVPENTVKAARRGDRLRRSTIQKLKAAISEVNMA